ncbi:polysaccharide transporter, PST family [Chitinophaga sp. YR573]|uniref:flippase n=1 Tax=Chitinophaga sp. YR573 TaxID=1881040 RepID=UPI0008C712D5|nr:flippase [Chitinophaga sp. YR573]SEW14397.1 polysaccharide transporter, PST family [Chitinophaga sp. YR573]
MLKERILSIIKNSTIKNILWLLFDKVFKLVIGLVVGVWVARYLGPGELGKMNYIAAYIGILTTIASLGMDQFLVKEILARPLEKSQLLGTALIFRIISVIILSLGLLGVFYMMHVDREYYLLYFVLLFTFIPTPFDLIDVEYQSRLQSRRTVIAKNSAYFVGAILKVVFILLHKPLLYFAAVVGAESLLAFLILILQYQIGSDGLQTWKFNLDLGGELLKKGWPFILSSIAIILYMRIDQVMLGNLLNSTAVGEFSAAVKITEIFIVIPIAVSSSYYSTLMNSINNNDFAGYRRKMQVLFNWMFLISFVIACGVTLCSDLIVHVLYGQQYVETAGIMRIHAWTIVTLFWGVVSSQYLVIENLQNYSLYRSVIGLVLNVGLNLILIPYMGAYGSAVATLISQLVSAVFGNLLFKPTRVIFKYQVNSVLNLILLRRKEYQYT